MPHADVAIAGAGIIGLSAALELASAGLRVEVFERGAAMRESSWAAAGMLAAEDPENPPALRPLSDFSLSLYPEFLATVERLSDHTVPFRTQQTFQGAHTLPAGAQPASEDVLRALAPGLHPNADGLTFFRIEERSFDPRDLARALPIAARAAGVTLHENAEVTAVASGPDVMRVETSRGTHLTAHFLNATGSWAAQLANVPVAPRKGQMLLVESPAPLIAVIRTPHLYLVPRGNGRIIIGATVEQAGFDRQVSPKAINALLQSAAALWPPAAQARIVDTWSGFRPFSDDALPIIGALGPRSWAALGHFRNGILLAPGTARLVRRIILNEPPEVDLAAFSPARFVSVAAQ